MIPAIPKNARLGTGGEAAFVQASQLFQPTNVRRVDSRAWRPSASDIDERADQGVFSPVGDRADARLWDVGGNSGRGVPMALLDNRASELGLAEAQADGLVRKKKGMR